MLNPKTLPNAVATSNSRLTKPIPGLSQKYNGHYRKSMFQVSSMRILHLSISNSKSNLRSLLASKSKLAWMLKSFKWENGVQPLERAGGLCKPWNSEFRELPSCRSHYLKAPWRINQQHFEVLLPACQLHTAESLPIKHFVHQLHNGTQFLFADLRATLDCFAA